MSQFTHFNLRIIIIIYDLFLGIPRKTIHAAWNHHRRRNGSSAGLGYTVWEGIGNESLIFLGGSQLLIFEIFMELGFQICVLDTCLLRRACQKFDEEEQWEMTVRQTCVPLNRRANLMLWLRQYWNSHSQQSRASVSCWQHEAHLIDLKAFWIQQKGSKATSD